MTEKSWFVYMIKANNNTLYTGITTNVNRRFKEHSEDTKKGAKYLRGKGPLTLMFHQEIGSKSDASKIECGIKKLTRKEKDALIYGYLELDFSFL